jgi:hypothetical protein
MKKPVPVVGYWYRETVEDLVFEVVAVDEDDETIELQHVDGEINEFDFTVWEELSLVQIEPPEDWRKAYGLSQEDSTDNEAVIRPDNGANPISGIEPQVTHGLLDD